MNKDIIMDAMEYIDPRMIEDADRGVNSGRRRLNKGMLIAACVCLMLLTTALATGIYIRGKLSTPEIEYHKNEVFEPTGEIKDGYRPVLEQQPEQPDGEPASTKVSLDSFNEAFLADVANKPESENQYRYYFDSWSDMEEYIGFNMWDNPVLDAANPFYLVTNDIRTHGYLSCTQIDGILTSVRAVAEYHMNPTQVPSGYPGINNTASVTVSITAAVYTKHSPIEEDRMFAGMYFATGTEFTDEVYTSPDGHNFRIVRVVVHTDFGDFIRYFGYACIDNVYITVESVFNPDEQVALSTLKQVLNGFVIE